MGRWWASFSCSRDQGKEWVTEMTWGLMSQQGQLSKQKTPFFMVSLTWIAEMHDFSASVDRNVNWASL